MPRRSGTNYGSLHIAGVPFDPVFDSTTVLGEAQTCYVIKNWADFAGSWWITDDREALRYARFQGITTRETIDLVAVAAINGDIQASAAFELLKLMADRDRHLRLPKTADDLIR